MAQAAATPVTYYPPLMNRGLFFYYAALGHVRFYYAVKAGCQLRLNIRLLRHRSNIAWFADEASINDRIICMARFTFAGEVPSQEGRMSNFVCDLLNGVVKLIPSGKELFHEEDEYGEIIVSEYKDYRMLRFDALYEQSKMNLHHPYMPVHHYVRAMLMAITWRECGPVLLLGLGGGSLLRALYAYAPTMQMDVVELRPHVLNVARCYFSLPSSGNISYYCEDALDYLRRDIGIRYSMIFSDLYSAMAMDPLQGREAFLRMCRNALSEDGWLVLNYLDMPGADSVLYHALYQVFSDVFFCPVPSGNVVIYARVSRGKCSPEALADQAAQICTSMFGEVKHLSGRLERL